VDAGPVAIFVADEEMRYVAVNRLAADMLGYTREELLALRVTDVARAPEAAREYAEMMRHGREGLAELTRKDGTTVTFRYLAQEPRVARMTLYVSVGAP
jgi:PAS domain S-box-containing protein